MGITSCVFACEGLLKMNSSDDSSSERCLFLEIPLHQTSLSSHLITATCVLNSLTIIPSVLGSAIILITMWGNPNLEFPSHVYLFCLALADFVTGLIVQPCYVIHKTAWLLGHRKLDCIARLLTETVAWISAAASCVMISTISLDRFLAVRLHMRYSIYMTRSRAIKYVVYILVSLTLISCSRYWASDNRPFVIIGVCGILSSVVTVVAAYLYIFAVLRRHKRKISAQNVCTSVSNGSENNASDIQSKVTRRSAVSLAYVVGLFVVTYVPFVGALIVGLVQGSVHNPSIAYDVTRTIVFTSSVLDPVIYCWKIPDVYVEVKKTWRNLRANVCPGSTDRNDNQATGVENFSVSTQRTAGNS
ncbi:predicted protein [Nematostella vectensis]|uniref:G-protein coupled receptors family 1 profile domain-containing protein n=1 Tax=Nematostella vectensis TaxID=45351 RepID=A7SMG9_NEMVE|nr:predicted protein [Nematostella vectensis]|eukprot:XP_001627228.1 predicted protein [Nematostella vectensis]